MGRWVVHIDVGIARDEPDQVVLPDNLSDGRYRICAWNVGEGLCAEFDVVA